MKMVVEQRTFFFAAIAALFFPVSHTQCIETQPGAPSGKCACDYFVDPYLRPIRKLLEKSGVRNLTACLGTMSDMHGGPQLAQVSWTSLLEVRFYEALQPLASFVCTEKNASCQARIGHISKLLASNISQSICNGGATGITDQQTDILSKSLARLVNGNLLHGPFLNYSQQFQSVLISSCIDHTVIQLPQILAKLSDTLASFHLPRRESFYPQNMFLLCTMFFPVCQTVRNVITKEYNLSASQNHTQQTVPVKPCPWSCTSASSIVDLTNKFQPNTSLLMFSPRYFLLRRISQQCAAEETVNNSQWSQCLDMRCNSMSAGQYVCQRESADYDSAKNQSNQICLRLDEKCRFPLLTTNNSKHWSDEAQDALRNMFNIVEGLLNVPMEFNGNLLPCGAACTGVIFNLQIESNIRTLVVVMAFITIIIQVLAIISFFLNRNKLNRFPTRVLIYISFCFTIACLTFLAQVSAGWKNIVCNSDGTLRDHLPGENSDGARSCVAIFVILYFSLITALLWWFCLTHAWFSTFRSMGNPRNPTMMERGVTRQELIYHAVVWPLAIVLCVVSVTAGQIDGVAMFGVCFTTNDKLWFLLMTVPVIILGVCGGPFLVKGISNLTTLRHRLNVMKDHRHGSQANSSAVGLQRYQAKLGILVVASFVHLLLQCAIGLYQQVEWRGWLNQIKKHVTCSIATCPDLQHLCPPLPQPSSVAFGLLVIAVFFEGIVLCSWMVTKENLEVWKMFFTNPVRIIRHGAYYGQMRRSSTGISNASVMRRNTAGNLPKPKRDQVAFKKSSTSALLHTSSTSTAASDQETSQQSPLSSLSNSAADAGQNTGHQVLLNGNKQGKMMKEKKRKKLAFLRLPAFKRGNDAMKMELDEYVCGADKVCDADTVFVDDHDDATLAGSQYGVYVTGRDKTYNDSGWYL